MEPVLTRLSTSTPANFAVEVGVSPIIFGRDEPLSMSPTAWLTAVELSHFLTSSVLVVSPLECWWVVALDSHGQSGHPVHTGSRNWFVVWMPGRPAAGLECLVAD